LSVDTARGTNIAGGTTTGARHMINKETIARWTVFAGIGIVAIIDARFLAEVLWVARDAFPKVFDPSLDFAVFVFALYGIGIGVVLVLVTETAVFWTKRWIPRRARIVIRLMPLAALAICTLFMSLLLTR